ncbi:MAG: hypothetical protein U0528_20845 [Anaerolineae bacterium]
MGQRLSLIDSVLTVRLDGRPEAITVATEIRSVLDSQSIAVYIILDFTHVTALDQNIKAVLFRGMQHPRVAPKVGVFGINRAILDDAKQLLTALANTRKVVVRDSEPEVRDALGLSISSSSEFERPKLSGMLNFSKKMQDKSTMDTETNSNPNLSASASAGSA